MTLLWSGLGVGAIYALIAITYNMIYTSVGVFNFAQGAILTLGVFIAYYGMVTVSWPWPVVALAAAAVCAATGVLEAAIVLRPRARGRNELLTTVGASTVITGVVVIRWGEDVRRVPAPISGRVLTILGGRVDPAQLVLIAMALGLAVGLGLWYRHTQAGLASLAVAEDRDAARMRGINVTRKSYGAFLAAGAVAGVAGIFVAPETFAYPELGSSVVLIAFVAFVLGGSGSLIGGLLGGLVLGLVQQYSARYVGVAYTNLITFGLLLAVLVALPNGVFGVARVRTV